MGFILEQSPSQGILSTALTKPGLQSWKTSKVWALAWPLVLHLVRLTGSRRGTAGRR